jgi:NAD(P)-dependent dehydrogenase (short-subunit alcohol dehydrogenase family)
LAEAALSNWARIGLRTYVALRAMSYWHDKVAVVTGGSRGLGRILAEMLAEHGAKVVVAARDRAGVDVAVQSIRARGGDGLGVPADVLRNEDVARLVDQAVAQFGRLDLLANCAGRSSRASILDTTPEDFQVLWDLNFLGTVRCARVAAGHLIQSRGHLVAVASLAAKTAGRYLGAYPASKFPLVAYCQQLRMEVGPEGLHVLLVCPGPLARQDAGVRYDSLSEALPPSARLPAGGAKVRAINPAWLAERILRACERREPELIVPSRARLLFAISQLAPRAGDWLLRRMT